MTVKKPAYNQIVDQNKNACFVILVFVSFSLESIILSNSLAPLIRHTLKSKFGLLFASLI